MSAVKDAPQTLAIVGFGDLGERIAGMLPKEQWQCVGFRRRAHLVPVGVKGVAIDFARPETLQILQDTAPDALLIALSPSRRDESGYREGFAEAMQGIVRGLGTHQPRVAYFVSSTRVYAENQGAWVDESSRLAEEDAFARHIIDAEKTFLSSLENAVVLRAGGLYGHAEGPLLKRVRDGQLTPMAPLRYANRIHRDDVARFVVTNLQEKPGASVINLIDDAPVPIQETEAWFCEKLSLAYAPAAGESEAPPQGKRIANARLKSTGFELAYADYRAGYEAYL